jgi:predicted DNA-binding protein with PD1-like motif/glutaredoxin
MQAVSLHLEPGSDVRLCLEQLAREQGASGFVLSVVGNLSKAAFQCPGKERPTVLAGELEIITLQGTLAPHGVHLHLSFSDSECQVWGGHLEPGTLVLKGADLLVGFLDDPDAPDAPSSAETTTDRAVAEPQPRVSIAVVEGCPYSWRALRLLRTLGIAHELVEPVAGRSVPQISIDGVPIGGYDALAALHTKGQLESLR